MIRLQNYAQIEAVNALRTIEQLVQRNPKVAILITHLKPRWTNCLRIALSGGSDKRAVAAGDHMHQRFVGLRKRQVAARAWNISRRGGADSGRARARKAEIGVPLVHGIHGRRVLVSEHHDSQRTTLRPEPEVVEGWWMNAVNAVFN